MQRPQLEVNDRSGRALAAYFRLPGTIEASVARSQPKGKGLIVDFDAEGTPVGIEIVDPERVTLSGLNEVLVSLGLEPATAEDLAPLRAA